MAVLDVFGLSKPDEEELPVGLAHDAWDAFSLNREKYKAITELFPDTGTRAEFLFPFSIYHNRWDEVTLRDFLPDQAIRYNVDRGADRIAEIIPSETMPVVGDNEIYDCDDPTNAMKYILRFVSDCKEMGIITDSRLSAVRSTAGTSEGSEHDRDRGGVLRHSL